MNYIIAFLAISIIIFAHELGHFWVAKKNGFPVSVFAIGMGPTLFSKKKGETTYKLNLFPLGGYVSFEGEGEETNSFTEKPILKRFYVLVAGVVFNVLLAILILFGISMTAGTPMRSFVIVDTEVGSPASEIFLKNDILLSVNGFKIGENTTLLTEAVENNEKSTHNVEVIRDNEIMSFDVSPFITETGEEKLGIYFYNNLNFVKTSDQSFIDILKSPFIETMNVFSLLFESLDTLISGEVSSEDISGPIGIVKISGDIASNDVVLFFYWIAVLSLNLAIMNALPIPALDGGQIMFLFFEFLTTKVFKKKWSHYFVHKINTVFLFMLFGFMIYICLIDFKNLFG